MNKGTREALKRIGITGLALSVLFWNAAMVNNEKNPSKNPDRQTIKQVEQIPEGYSQYKLTLKNPDDLYYNLGGEK